MREPLNRGHLTIPMSMVLQDTNQKCTNPASCKHQVEPCLHFVVFLVKLTGGRLRVGGLGRSATEIIGPWSYVKVTPNQTHIGPKRFLYKTFFNIVITSCMTTFQATLKPLPQKCSIHITL